MKIAIFIGPRKISANDEQLVRSVVREVVARGFQIYVGDAAGVDAVVADEAYPRGFQQFFLRPELGRTPAGLAEHSTRMVKEALHAGADEILCIGFPNKSCPNGIVPARSWRSGGTEGSGTWSTLALCVGHEIETWIIPLSSCSLSRQFISDRAWAGLEWHQFGKVFTGWHFTPAPSLFTHEELANGWT